MAKNNMFESASAKRKEEINKIVNSSEPKKEKEEAKVIYTKNENKKMISAQVSISVYEKFTEINKKAGLKNNAVINNLIWAYVEDHKKEL